MPTYDEDIQFGGPSQIPTYRPESRLRKAFAEKLASERKKTLGDIQSIYAGRGTTGSGEEATAYGLAGEGFGRATGEFEANLLSDLERQKTQKEQFGQQFGLQEQQLGAQREQFGKTLAEQIAQRQQQGEQFGQEFGVGQQERQVKEKLAKNLGFQSIEAMELFQAIYGVDELKKRIEQLNLSNFSKYAPAGATYTAGSFNPYNPLFFNPPSPMKLL